MMIDVSSSVVSAGGGTCRLDHRGDTVLLHSTCMFVPKISQLDTGANQCTKTLIGHLAEDCQWTWTIKNFQALNASIQGKARRLNVSLKCVCG